jgi:hypothetical protein
LCNIHRKRDPDLEAADKDKHRVEEMQRRIRTKLQAAPVEELDEDELEWLMDSTDIASSRYLAAFTKFDCYL